MLWEEQGLWIWLVSIVQRFELLVNVCLEIIACLEHLGLAFFVDQEDVDTPPLLHTLYSICH